MPITSNNKVEISGSTELIQEIYDIGNSYKLDRQADQSPDINNNFFTPFYSANKDYELNEVQGMIEELVKSGEDHVKALVSGALQQEGFRREIIIKAMGRSETDNWDDIDKAIMDELEDFKQQSNMYFEARHKTDKTEGFKGANIPEISDVEVERIADKDGFSKLSFTYLSAYAPDYSILHIMAKAINQKQKYEASKSSEYNFNDMNVVANSLTEDSSVSKFKLSLSDKGPDVSIDNSSDALGDIYHIEEFDDFKKHVDEIVAYMDYKEMDIEDIEHLFVATQVKGMLFTDYTHKSLEIPFSTVELEPTLKRLKKRDLKILTMSDTYIETLNRITSATTGNEQEKWLTVQGVAKSIYEKIENANSTEEAAKIVQKINEKQSQIGAYDDEDRFVFDKLLDCTRSKGVQLLSENTQPTEDVIKLIDSSILMNKGDEDFVKYLQKYKMTILEKGINSEENKKPTNSTTKNLVK